MPKQTHQAGGMHRFRNRLLAGMLLLVPLVVTVLVLRFLFGIVRDLLNPVLNTLGASGLPSPVALAISLVALLLVVYFAGLLAANVLGGKVIALGEGLVGRVPLAKSIYASSRKTVDMLSSGRARFKSVALLEYPGPGLKAIAFVTGIVIDDEGRRCYKPFVPTAPNPTSGFLQIVPQEKVVATKLSVEDGINMVMSGGILLPEKLERAEEQ